MTNDFNPYEARPVEKAQMRVLVESKLKELSHAAFQVLSPRLSVPLGEMTTPSRLQEKHVPILYENFYGDINPNEIREEC